MLRKETEGESFIGRHIAQAIVAVPELKVQFVEGREWILLVKNEKTGEFFEISIQGNIDPGAWDDTVVSEDFASRSPFSFQS